MKKTPKIVKLQNIRPRALRVRDAAAYCGLAEKTLRNRMNPNSKNPFPPKPRRMGGKPIFLVEDLDAYLDSLPLDS